MDWILLDWILFQKDIEIRQEENGEWVWVEKVGNESSVVVHGNPRYSMSDAYEDALRMCMGLQVLSEERGRSFLL